MDDLKVPSSTIGFNGGHGRNFPKGVTAIRHCIGAGPEPTLPDMGKVLSA